MATPLLQLQVTFAVLHELTLSPGMLRYCPFTPSWRVALRSIGAWPRSAGVVWLADRYLRSAVTRGLQGPRASLRNIVE